MAWCSRRHQNAALNSRLAFESVQFQLQDPKGNMEGQGRGLVLRACRGPRLSPFKLEKSPSDGHGAEMLCLYSLPEKRVKFCAWFSATHLPHPSLFSALLLLQRVTPGVLAGSQLR